MALVAACVLLYVAHWMFRKAYVGDWVAEIRRRTSAVTGSGEIATMFGGLTVFGLAFLVVFREGFETVLFYEALLADAPAMPVLAGLVAGAALAAMVAYLTLGLEARLPVAASGCGIPCGTCIMICPDMSLWLRSEPILSE